MDRDCLVSRRLFELDFRVATFTDGRWQETFTLAAVQAMKTDPDHGYNVLAWRGDLQPALLAAF